MSGGRTKRLLLWCAATDSTFELGELASGKRVLYGKCIHCNRRLMIGADGSPLGRETVEHIVPRNHGGTDAIENLAIACSRCNHGKGVRHDARAWDDPGLQRVISTLQDRRRARWREPPEELDMPPRPADEPSQASARKKKGRRRR